MDKMSTGAILVRFFACFLRAAQKPKIAELVSTGDRLIINHCGASRPSCYDIIYEGYETVFLLLVDDIDDAFLNVTDDDAASLCLQPNDEVRNNLSLAFAKELFKTEIINPEFIPYASNETALEGKKSGRWLLSLGFMNEL